MNQIKAAGWNRKVPPRSTIKAAHKKRKSALITQLSPEAINLANKIHKFHYLN